MEDRRWKFDEAPNSNLLTSIFYPAEPAQPIAFRPAEDADEQWVFGDLGFHWSLGFGIWSFVWALPIQANRLETWIRTAGTLIHSISSPDPATRLSW